MRKAIFILLSLVFLAFALLQLNDPDPIVWILMYGAMAVVCVMAAFDYYIKRFMIVLTIVYVGYASTLSGSILLWLQSDDKAMLFDDIAKMQNLYIEESREFLGLMICLTVLAACWILRARQSSELH